MSRECGGETFVLMESKEKRWKETWWEEEGSRIKFLREKNPQKSVTLFQPFPTESLSIPLHKIRLLIPWGGWRSLWTKIMTFTNSSPFSLTFLFFPTLSFHFHILYYSQQEKVGKKINHCYTHIVKEKKRSSRSSHRFLGDKKLGVHFHWTAFFHRNRVLSKSWTAKDVDFTDFSRMWILPVFRVYECLRQLSFTTKS